MVNLIQLIQDNYETFTPQEKIVADNFLEYPRFILDKNISGLAASIGVSRNSITRFCKTLGFSGYTEFKFEFSKFLTLQQGTSDDSNKNLVHEIIHGYKGKLDEILNQNLIKEEGIFELAKEISTASSIKILGTGKSTPPGLQLKYSLQTLGIYAQMMDSLFIADDMEYLFSKEDIVIVYSVSGKSLFTNQILAGALKKKAKIYMITTSKKINLNIERVFVLPNVSQENPFVFSNHTLFYIFNDMLCNAINYGLKDGKTPKNRV
ncbi:N-acetylmannosamine kinase [Bacillus sp. J14TS2]|uniref:MurR/RpiR family transcriptional regulator n=1 Tax=Bacillus sp. J14TS2 TaxID=2807188 RepID=UPI001B231647|nr:MurR/RpiR family transcriptional regulator [Bacillus sp. J14TS2]GIN71524.1 N-acetylmannosamine kinase [Bacillus sp. J14TS2]